MADTPNYRPNVGRLVTDRYDFEKHINGEDFAHTGNFPASQITVTPAITIDSIEYSDVNSGLQGIATFLANPITVSDATERDKGIIQLAGDISGSSTNIVVNGLRGRTVSDTAPTDGYILTWESGTTSWKPKINTATFVANNDLSGSNLSQNVISLTGDSGILQIKCSNLRFDETMEPTIYSVDNSTTDGLTFQIIGQNSTASNSDGGDVLIIAGQANGAGSGINGSILLQTNDGATVLKAGAISSDRIVLSLLGDAGAVEMPSNTGDGIIYIANATTDPTSGNPVNGSILYSSGGTLRVKQSDGTDFQIGSLPNPVTWGTDGQQISTTRIFTTTAAGGSVGNVNPFVIPDKMFVVIDATFLCKSITGECGYYHKIMSVKRDSTSTTVGSVADVETEQTNFSISTPPTITRSSNLVSILTGVDSTYDLNWLIIIKLSFIEAS